MRGAIHVTTAPGIDRDCGGHALEECSAIVGRSKLTVSSKRGKPCLSSTASTRRRSATTSALPVSPSLRCFLPTLPPTRSPFVQITCHETKPKLFAHDRPTALELATSTYDESQLHGEATDSNNHDGLNLRETRHAHVAPAVLAAGVIISSLSACMHLAIGNASHSRDARLSSLRRDSSIPSYSAQLDMCGSSCVALFHHLSEFPEVIRFVIIAASIMAFRRTNFGPMLSGHTDAEP